jgi:hypothetical protein
MSRYNYDMESLSPPSAVVMILWGLVYAFLGYILYKFAYFVFGILAGGQVGFHYGPVLLNPLLGEVNPIYYAIAGIILGLLLAAILRRLILFLVGALTAVAFLNFIGPIFNFTFQTYPGIYLIGFVTGGAIAVLLEKPIIILFTSFAGASIVAVTLANTLAFFQSPVMKTIVTLIVFVLGLCFQYNLHYPKSRARES